MEEGGKQKFKIVMLGASGAGKTALVNYWVNHEMKEFTAPTIGATYQQKVVDHEGTLVKVQVWDTAGQERYRSIAPVYARNALGALVVFDVTSQASFKDVKEWVNCARKVGDFPICIVGNKVDMGEDRVVQLTEAMKLANDYGFNYWETSAKTGQNVEEAFTELVAEAIAYRNASESVEATRDNVNITHEKQGQGGGCC